ncbi:MAG TPA: alkaline phosphatase family protein [bacterium]|nr:alkaline phosphatase family protein [bacterium]
MRNLQRWFPVLFLIAVIAWLAPAHADDGPGLSTELLDKIIQPALDQQPDIPPEIPRILLIGFDGFTWRQIQPLLDQGELPHFAKVLKNGAGIRLQATDFPSSAASWPSIMTGCSPDKTGIYSFFRMDPDTYELHLNHAGYRKTKALWEIVSDAGFPVFAVNVPMSWPPDTVNGTIITGLLSPENGVFTHPPELSAPLRDAGYVTGYRRFRETLKFGGPAFTRNGDDMDVNTLFDIALNRYRVVHYLVTRTPWRFGAVVFTLADRFQHNQTALGTPMIQHACKQMDVLLGGLMNAIPSNTYVVVCSDHGFRKYETTFLLGEWLRRNGYIVTGGDSQPDFEKTRLIPLDRVGNAGLYRWNIQGRESRGTVPLSAKSEMVQQLEKRLNEIRDASGSPVVRHVRIFSGDDGGPDILVELTPDLLLNNFLDVPGPLERTLEQPVYDHEHNGVGIVSGPGIRPSGNRINASVLDIAPTCTYAAGLPVPDTMDGTVLTQLFTPQWFNDHPVRVNGSSDRKVRNITKPLKDESVMNQLKSLGYIQ